MDLPGLSQASSLTLAPAPPTSLHRLPSGSQPSVASTGFARQPPPAVPNCQPLSTIQPPSSTFLVNPLPTLDSILRVRLSTLQHVPKEARDAWAGLIADQCSTIVQDPSNLHAWRKFFMLPRCILANPTRGGRTQWRITQVLVKTWIRRWLAGEFMELWNDVLAEEERHARKNGKKKTPLETLRKSNARRARQAMGDGCYRKAIQALSSGGLGPPPIPPDPTPSPPNISDQDVLRALKSFPSGSAPGPSSLRANHLKEAVLCPSPDRAAQAIRALSGVVRLLAAGCAPQEVIPHLCGATLLACVKKSGGLRPIAVGEVLRRLTSKCLSRAVQEVAISTLSPPGGSGSEDGM